jgi:translocation and assembly module TamA
VTIESPFFPEPITEKIAALEASVVREGRDNPINARRGHFLSFSLERAGLGSDFKFLKTLTQGFFNRRLNRHLTWSQGYRLGLAWGRQGQDVVSSERFQAGGANTMRPFAEESLGPRNVLGQVTGGEGLLIFNQELRVSHSSGLGAAIFYDAGNVFERVRDIGFDLRHGAGVGVRYDSPIGLLRLDVGFPFARKSGEDAYQVYFSLGQAF